MLFVGGVLTLAVVAPNIFGAAGRLLKQKRFFNKNDLNKTKRYLKNKNYVQFKKVDNNSFEMRLTSKGQRTALRDAFYNLKIKPEKWDGIWRIIVFDIPNKNKWGRDALRRKLKQMGFYQLQKSVFATPYPCQKEIDFIVATFDVADCVRLIEARSLNDDKDIKDFFNLSQPR